MLQSLALLILILKEICFHFSITNTQTAFVHKTVSLDCLLLLNTVFLIIKHNVPNIEILF